MCMVGRLLGIKMHSCAHLPRLQSAITSLPFTADWSGQTNSVFLLATYSTVVPISNYYCIQYMRQRTFAVFSCFYLPFAIWKRERERESQNYWDSERERDIVTDRETRKEKICICICLAVQTEILTCPFGRTYINARYVVCLQTGPIRLIGLNGLNRL
jgi:hypothetical protein